MLINVTKIKSTAEKSEEIYRREALDAAGGGYPELALCGPVEFSGRIEHAAPYFHLKGELKAELELVCSRCLAKFRQTFSVPVAEVFTNREAALASDDEIGFFEGDELDIAPALLKALFMELPLRPLCWPDCQGLCPNCGADLNLGPCACAKDDVDWRFEKLKTLFAAMNDDKEV